MSSISGSGYFVSQPMRDPSLWRVFNLKELIAVGLGVGFPLWFASKLVASEELAKHSILWKVSIIIWMLACTQIVTTSLLKAIKLRRHAAAVDADAVVLASKLYRAERANGRKSRDVESLLEHIDWSLIDANTLVPFDEGLDETFFEEHSHETGSHEIS